MRNTVSRRNARGASGALPHPSMLCKESYHGKERKQARKKDQTSVQEGSGRDKESERIYDIIFFQTVC